MESVWGECKSKFLGKLSLRCLLHIQVKMLSRQLNMSLKVRAGNTNLRVIRIFIDSIYRYGTGRVISIDSERRGKERTKGEPTLRGLEEKMPAS